MLIQMEKAVKTYSGFQLNTTLEVRPGRITGLIGRNGAGKSTAMGLILGLMHPEKGSVRVFGKEPMTLTTEEKARIGVVLSEGGFSEYLMPTTIASMLEALYPGVEKFAFLQKMQAVGLPIDKPIKDYSKGMKARFDLLCAMSHDTDLLILDEPTAGLDVLARDEILDLLRDYMAEEEGRGILISSHISSDLESLCDDLYMIEDGRIVLHEDTDRILSEYAILKLRTEQYEAMDKRYICYRKKESYGISALTDRKSFYVDNYPDIAMDSGSIDGVMTMILRGEKV
ncbi:MAG: ABC transporter ATP-binding protein [Clostridia bacterium]|nr:ABC transporter ATP-binding protein [Clostridia bacterium]